MRRRQLHSMCKMFLESSVANLPNGFLRRANRRNAIHSARSTDTTPRGYPCDLAAYNLGAKMDQLIVTGDLTHHF
jgi:hypothetical protein